MTARTLAQRVVPVLRSPDAQAALSTAGVLAEEGFTSVEITFTIPDAAHVIARLRATAADRVVGAGTVTTIEQVDRAIDAGAEFVVAPGFDRALHDAARSRGILYVPGALTPTEVSTAFAAGLEMIKLFPAEPLGPGYLKALRGPFPGVSFVPTGGIRSATLGDWIEAGATALGVGGQLSAPDAAAVRQEARAIRQRLEATQWQI